jgi:hypothetical protein
LLLAAFFAGATSPPTSTSVAVFTLDFSV